MILKDFLETLDEETEIAIGAQNGNGFIYRGKDGEIELIDKTFDDCLTEKSKRLDEVESRLKYLILNPVKMDKDEKENTEKIHLRASEISDAYRSIKGLKKYVDRFKPVLDREVSDHYHKDVDNCMAVIVEGFEREGYWFRKEFDCK